MVIPPEQSVIEARHLEEEAGAEVVRRVDVPNDPGVQLAAAAYSVEVCLGGGTTPQQNKNLDNRHCTTQRVVPLLQVGSALLGSALLCFALLSIGLETSCQEARRRKDLKGCKFAALRDCKVRTDLLGEEVSKEVLLQNKR